MKTAILGNRMRLPSMPVQPFQKKALVKGRERKWHWGSWQGLLSTEQCGPRGLWWSAGTDYPSSSVPPHSGAYLCYLPAFERYRSPNAIAYRIILVPRNSSVIKNKDYRSKQLLSLGLQESDCISLVKKGPKNLGKWPMSFPFPNLGLLPLSFWLLPPKTQLLWENSKYNCMVTECSVLLFFVIV